MQKKFGENFVESNIFRKTTGKFFFWGGAKGTGPETFDPTTPPSLVACDSFSQLQKLCCLNRHRNSGILQIRTFHCYEV